MQLTDELRAKGIEVRENVYDSNEISICCPFCVQMGESPDFKFRCGINIASGLGHCFNCGWSSRKAVLELVRLLGIAENVDQLITQQYTRQSRQRPKTVELPEGTELLAECEDDDPVFAPAIRYVKKRGITRDQIARYEIGANATHERFQGRVIFPVRNKYEDLTGFIGRDYTGHNYPRFLNMVGSKAVFNARLDRYSQRLGILSEGIVKALAIERALSNQLCSMAVLGNSITDEQAVQLLGFQEIALFGDPGGPGVRGFLGVAANISTFTQVSIAWPWPEKQADDLTEGEIRRHLRGRILYTPLAEMRIRMELL
jgi:DNA primase catalytic core, N-terminal domain